MPEKQDFCENCGQKKEDENKEYLYQTIFDEFWRIPEIHKTCSNDLEEKIILLNNVDFIN